MVRVVVGFIRKETWKGGKKIYKIKTLYPI
jgi:hypothetical protein